MGEEYHRNAAWEIAMTGMSFVINPASRRTALSVVGTNVTVLVSSADSEDQPRALESSWNNFRYSP